MSRRKGKSALKRTKETFIGRQSFFSVFGIPIAIVVVVLIVVPLVSMLAV